VIDPFTHNDQQANLREALKQPQITDHIRTDVTATDGDLARKSLDDLGSVERLPRPHQKPTRHRARAPGAGRAAR
jgi:hypothetical protein